MAEKAQSSRRRGRPTKKTIDLMVAIALDLADGSSKRAAARRAGISPDTLYSWRRKDQEFADMLLRAIALFEDRLVETIWRAAEEGTTTLYYGPDGAVLLERQEYHWEAAAWLLEHHPNMRNSPSTGVARHSDDPHVDTATPSQRGQPSLRSSG